MPRKKKNFYYQQKITGKRIEELIEERYLSKAALAREVGISRQAIASYIDGKGTPDANMIVLLCRYFNVSADYLLGLSDTRGDNDDHKGDTLLTHSALSAIEAIEQVDMLYYGVGQTANIPFSRLGILSRMISSDKTPPVLSDIRRMVEDFYLWADENKYVPRKKDEDFESIINDALNFAALKIENAQDEGIQDQNAKTQYERLERVGYSLYKAKSGLAEMIDEIVRP